jgi:hypothetical protein
VETLNTCMENAKFKVSTEYDGKPRKLYEKSCIICNESFWLPKHRYENQQTCSARCRGKLITNCRPTFTCSYCGKSSTRAANKLNNSRHGHNFCNRKCKEAAQRLDGNCPDIRPKHYGNGNGEYTYRHERLKIADKCGCGETRRFILAVHHRDGNRKNNNPSNLETVCFNCHALRHLKRNKSGEWQLSFRSLTSEEDLKELMKNGDVV